MSRYNNDRNGTFQGILSMQIINIFGNRKRPKNRLLKIPAHLYVDSDFAGLWPYEDKTKPVSVKSRMGFAMRLADCPIVWGSKLVAEIAMSTMEIFPCEWCL